MQLSHLKRPLFLCLLAYIGLVLFLDARGFWDVPSASEEASGVSPRVAALEGRVLSVPQWRGSLSQFVLELDRFNGRPARGRIWVRWPESPEVQRGERWSLAGLFQRPAPAAYPGQWDFSRYLARRRIYSVLGVVPSYPAQKLGKDLFFVLRYADALRQKILKTFEARFSQPQAAILAGIVLGERLATLQEVREAFQDAGVMHLLVASGSNVAFVIGLCLWVGRMLGLRLPVRLGWAVVLSGGYTLVAGADAPLLRAYSMAVFGILGYFLARDSGAFQGLVLSGFLILLVEPLSLFQAGFQMSYVATLGILVAVPRWGTLLKESVLAPSAALRVPAGASGKPSVLGYSVGMLFFVSLAAQLALTPLLVHYFHRLSTVAVVSNLILVPLAAILLGAGFVFYLLSLFPLPWFCSLGAQALQLALDIFWFLTRWFASLPGSSVTLFSWNFLGWLSFYCGFLALTGWRSSPASGGPPYPEHRGGCWRSHRTFWMLCLSSGAFGLGGWVLDRKAPIPKQFEYLQDREGWAVAGSPDGKRRWVVDGGLSEEVWKDYRLSRRLRRADGLAVVRASPKRILPRVREWRTVPSWDPGLSGFFSALPEGAAGGFLWPDFEWEAGSCRLRLSDFSGWSGHPAGDPVSLELRCGDRRWILSSQEGLRGPPRQYDTMRISN